MCGVPGVPGRRRVSCFLGPSLGRMVSVSFCPSSRLGLVFSSSHHLAIRTCLGLCDPLSQGLFPSPSAWTLHGLAPIPCSLVVLPLCAAVVSRCSLVLASDASLPTAGPNFSHLRRRGCHHRCHGCRCRCRHPLQAAPAARWDPLHFVRPCNLSVECVP